MNQNSNLKIYYDDDANINIIKNAKVGIIGYGIQGRAISLNLRDSKINIRVGNRKDIYYDKATEDGFNVMEPQQLSKWSDIIFYLIPDEAQIEKYDSWLKPYLTRNKTIVFAHGYAIYHKKMVINDNVDIVLLAPRMPGKYVRERYLRGWGAPVFIDPYQDYSGNAKNTVLALSKAIGATKVGAMEISLEEETELDLFIEQFILPRITNTLQQAFNFLTSYGFTPEAVISEIYASKEIGKLLADAGDTNLYKIFMDNASPTCQFGKMRNIDRSNKILPSEHMNIVLKEIKESIFYKALDEEAKNDYKNLKSYNKKIEDSDIVKTHNRYNKLHLKEPN